MMGGKDGPGLNIRGGSEVVAGWNEQDGDARWP